MQIPLWPPGVYPGADDANRIATALSTGRRAEGLQGIGEEWQNRRRLAACAGIDERRSSSGERAVHGSPDQASLRSFHFGFTYRPPRKKATKPTHSKMSSSMRNVLS